MRKLITALVIVAILSVVALMGSTSTGNALTVSYRYAPVVMKNAYGSWTTTINIVNAGETGNRVTINFYDESGYRVFTDANDLNLHETWRLYQGDLGNGIPAGFRGSAELISFFPISVVVHENGPNGATMAYSAERIP